MSLRRVVRRAHKSRGARRSLKSRLKTEKRLIENGSLRGFAAVCALVNHRRARYERMPRFRASHPEDSGRMQRRRS